MNNSIKLLVEKKNNSRRIDVFLSEKIKNYSRSYIKKLIKEKQVQLNKSVIGSPSVKVKTNDKIQIKLVEIQENFLKPYNKKLDVIYEDSDIIIINKPKGMVVHPGAGNKEKTLANALIYRYKNYLSDVNGILRPGIVHRIDKETSGLLVVAKNNFAHSKLSEQFNNHSIKRTYKCLVWGIIRPLKGKIQTLIARNKRNRQLMAVSEINGKKAITNYETLKVFTIKDIPKISLIECKLETGRTHQIRVHLKHKGTSLLGDRQYGKKNINFRKINETFNKNLKALKGQALHAQTLEFIHPSKNKWVSFNSKVSKDFDNILNFLNNLSS